MISRTSISVGFCPALRIAACDQEKIIHKHAELGHAQLKLKLVFKKRRRKERKRVKTVVGVQLGAVACTNILMSFEIVSWFLAYLWSWPVVKYRISFHSCSSQKLQNSPYTRCIPLGPWCTLRCWKSGDEHWQNTLKLTLSDFCASPVSELSCSTINLLETGQKLYSAMPES